MESLIDFFKKNVIKFWLLIFMICLNNVVVDFIYKWFLVLVRGIKKKFGVFGIEFNFIFVLCVYYFGIVVFFIFYRVVIFFL